MTERSQGHLEDRNDRSYEPPAVEPLGAVDSFTQGDQLASVDEPA